MSSAGFLEDPTVGGTPCFTWTIRNWLPRNKKKREFVYRVQMFILTYITYSLFNMARRPIAVVKSKIIEECSNGTLTAANNPSTWCNEALMMASTEEFLGLLDFLYICSYGVCLYMSGIVADCYNPRFYLTAGCLLSGFFCAVLGLADHWKIHSFKFLGTILVLFGASQSTSWPVVLSSATHWYSGGKRGMFFGFWNTHNYLGSVLGIFLAGTWVDKDWKWSFFVPGFILALMAIVVYLCMVVDPKDLRELDKDKTKASSKSRISEMEIPPWLSSNRSIKMYDAWRLPGVIEFSTCMFFSRMVGYIFLFWLPVFIQRAKQVSATVAAYYSLAYVAGGSIGGVLAGILVDLFKRSAMVCAFFLLGSIPILLLFHISELGKAFEFDFPLILIVGLFVEAPYVVISTSVSAELGTHKMIKRNHRALSTIGGIIEGTGAIGASIGTFICGVIITKTDWLDILYIMMGLQILAILCLSRQVYKEFFKKQKRRLSDYWKAPSL